MWLWRWITSGRDSERTGDWDWDGDALRRDLLSDFNDGIISAAAIIQGLLTGGATGREAVIGVLALIIIGMIAAGASKYNESAGERGNMLAVYESEQKALNRSPKEEEEELVRLYEAKGLSHGLSVQVARELMEVNPLGAQLDEEFDIDEIPGPAWPWQRAFYSAVTFAVGSALPLLLLLVLPWHTRGEITTVFVVISLAISGWVGHFSEHTSAWNAIIRTVLMGLVVLGISTLAGSLVTF